MEKLLLVDGHYLLFQMFFGMPARMRGKNGRPIHAVVGFIGALLRVVRAVNATRMIVVFDGETGNFRTELQADYKAGREVFADAPEEENPFSQLAEIQRILTMMGIPFYEVVENLESDDVIAAYAKAGCREGDVYILSADKDFLQLVDEHVFVYVYRGKRSMLYDVKTVEEKFGVAPYLFADYRSLVGDASDHIGGVRGIGPKTAQTLLSRYGGVEQLLAHPEQIENPKWRTRLLENAEKIRRNKALIALSGEASLPFSINRLGFSVPETEKTMDILKRADLV